MEVLFTEITWWHWIGFAALALIIEMLTGTGFLLWVSSAAALVGILLLVFNPITIGAQCLIFALLSILSAIAWKFYLIHHPIKTDHTTLNRRAEQYIGRVFTLQSPIVNGMGSIHVDDSMWRAKCREDLSKGEKVRVIKTDGVFLIIEKMS